jgi:hypothetical protein
MKKLLAIIVLGLLFSGCSPPNENSDLPNCKGKDYKNWTNCYGTVLQVKLDPGITRDYTGEFGNTPGIREGWGFSKVYKNNKSDFVYKGFFKNDKAHGEGVETHAAGWVQRGIFVNGRVEGYGHQLLPNGDTYMGLFKKTRPDGYGVYYTKETGKEFHAIWKNGKPVSDDPKVLLAKKYSDEIINGKIGYECGELGFEESGQEFADCKLQLLTLYTEEEIEERKIIAAVEQAEAAQRQAAASAAQAEQARRQVVAARAEAEAAERRAYNSRQRASNELSRRGLRMLSGACTLGVNC